MPMDDKLVEVTQEDRDAAHAFEFGPGDGSLADLASHFARHRLAAIAAARPVIVEDAMIALKDELTACYSGEGVYVLSSLIDLQIERAAAIRAIARGEG